MDINFELYKVFYAVAQRLSFSGAATTLCLSQSAVSQSVKSLEEKLACRLFLRSTKRVKLTPEGEMLFQYVEKAYNFLKTGEESILALHSLMSGQVRIGASDTICKHFLLPYFRHFNILYPQITLQITNRTSPQCLDLLHNGALDLAVVNIPARIAYDHLQVRRLEEIHDVCVAGDPFRHLAGKPVPLADLAQYPLLMLEKESVTRRFIDGFLKSRGISLVPEIELGSVDLLVEMAKIGLGLSFVVREFIQWEIASGSVFCLQLSESFPPRYLGLVTSGRLPLTPAAQRFAGLLPQGE